MNMEEILSQNINIKTDFNILHNAYHKCIYIMFILQINIKIFNKKNYDFDPFLKI